MRHGEYFEQKNNYMSQLYYIYIYNYYYMSPFHIKINEMTMSTFVSNINKMTMSTLVPYIHEMTTSTFVFVYYRNDDVYFRCIC